MPDVFQRQLVKLEGVLEEVVVGVSGILDVQPESLLPVAQAGRDIARDGLNQRPLRGDEVSGYLISAPAPASLSFFRTLSASSRLTPCLTGLGA